MILHRYPEKGEYIVYNFNRISLIRIIKELPSKDDGKKYLVKVIYQESMDGLPDVEKYDTSDVYLRYKPSEFVGVEYRIFRSSKKAVEYLVLERL